MPSTGRCLLLNPEPLPHLPCKRLLAQVRGHREPGHHSRPRDGEFWNLLIYLNVRQLELVSVLEGSRCALRI